MLPKYFTMYSAALVSPASAIALLFTCIDCIGSVVVRVGNAHRVLGMDIVLGMDVVCVGME